MGLLDQPPIADMDRLEKQAYKGDEEALNLIFETLRPVHKVYIQRLVRNEGLTMRQAFERAGILICLR